MARQPSSAKRASVQVLPANFTSADLERLEATWLVGVRSEYGNGIPLRGFQTIV